MDFFNFWSFPLISFLLEALTSVFSLNNMCFNKLDVESNPPLQFRLIICVFKSSLRQRQHKRTGEIIQFTLLPHPFFKHFFLHFFLGHCTWRNIRKPEKTFVYPLWPNTQSHQHNDLVFPYIFCKVAPFLVSCHYITLCVKTFYNILAKPAIEQKTFRFISLSNNKYCISSQLKMASR